MEKTHTQKETVALTDRTETATQNFQNNFIFFFECDTNLRTKDKKKKNIKTC